MAWDMCITVERVAMTVSPGLCWFSEALIDERRRDEERLRGVGLRAAPPPELLGTTWRLLGARQAPSSRIKLRPGRSLSESTAHRF